MLPYEDVECMYRYFNLHYVLPLGVGEGVEELDEDGLAWMVRLAQVVEPEAFFAAAL